MRRLHLQVDQGDIGARLDRFVAERRRSLSRVRVVRLIDEGHVRVDGEVVRRAAFKLKRAGEVTVDVPPAVDEPAWLLESSRVLFEDDWLLAIDKPALLPVKARLTLGGADVVSGATAYLAGKGGGPALTPHRLDRETSGVLLLARDAGTARSLHRAFLESSVAKTYVAVVHGEPRATSGRITAPILALPRELPRIDGAGRPAVTRFRVVRRGAVSLLALRLFTGRTHQLRLHLAHLGHPIVGDGVHGRAGGAPRVLLHARHLALRHPRTGERLSVRAPIPPDLALER